MEMHVVKRLIQNLKKLICKVQIVPSIVSLSTVATMELYRRVWAFYVIKTAVVEDTIKGTSVNLRN